MGRSCARLITRVRRTMARLPTPVPPPVRHVDRAALSDPEELDDQESLAKTVERKSVRITTARFASVAPCAIDVVPASASASAASPAASSTASWSLASWSSFATTLLRDPRGAIGAALWLACVVAGVTGVLLGHARTSHAAATVAEQASRAPRTAVVVEANQEMTQFAILAPGKIVESPVAAAISPRVRPQRRSGFGHMGADRVASGGAARRAAPHRH